MPCLIQKASRCAADRMSKTIVFYLSLSIKHKDLMRKSCVFIFYFIGSVVKIVFLFSLHKGRQTSKELKRNMKYCFSDVFTYRLNLKNFVSLFFLIQDNFMF